MLWQLAWNPHVDTQFATALENGTVQIWDTRNDSVSVHKIPAHDVCYHDDEIDILLLPFEHY